jgi:hypothetical protein
MAVSSYGIFEVRSGGASTFPGVFDPLITMDNTLFTSTGTSIYPTISSTNYPFKSSDVNNYLYIKSGTNWTPGWYQITGLAGTSAIVNASSNQYMKANMFRGASSGVGTSDSLSSGSWAIDYSQNSNCNTSYNDIFVQSASVISSTGNTFNVAMLGNGIHLVGNSGITTGTYIIAGIAGTRATLDRNAGNTGFAGGVGFLGGALNNIYNSMVAGVLYSGASVARIYVKADGEYSAFGTTIIFGAFYPHVLGYGTYRDDKVRPTIRSVSPDTNVFRRWDGTWTRTSNFIFENGFCRNSTWYAFTNNQPYSTMTNITFRNMTAYCYGSGLVSVRSEVLESVAVQSNTQFYCVTRGLAGSGNAIFSNTFFYGCHFYDTSVSNALYWNNPGNTQSYFINNVISDLSGSGNFSGNYNNFGINNPFMSLNLNNIFCNVRGTVFYNVSDYAFLSFINSNNAYFNCAALGTTAGLSYANSRQVQYNDFVLTQDPFINALNKDFRLNDAIQGGRLARYKALNNNYRDIVNLSNDDLGAFQTPNTIFHVGMNGGMRG